MSQKHLVSVVVTGASAIVRKGARCEVLAVGNTHLVGLWLIVKADGIRMRDGSSQLWLKEGRDFKFKPGTRPFLKLA